MVRTDAYTLDVLRFVMVCAPWLRIQRMAYPPSGCRAPSRVERASSTTHIPPLHGLIPSSTDTCGRACRRQASWRAHASSVTLRITHPRHSARNAPTGQRCWRRIPYKPTPRAHLPPLRRFPPTHLCLLHTYTTLPSTHHSPICPVSCPCCHMPGKETHDHSCLGLPPGHSPHAPSPLHTLTHASHTSTFPLASYRHQTLHQQCYGVNPLQHTHLYHGHIPDAPR